MNKDTIPRNQKFLQRINRMSIADALLAYVQQGKAVFPCRAIGDPLKLKAPLLNTWAQYQKVLPTMYEARRWIDDFPVMAIGMVTGEINGIYVLDTDTDIAEAWVCNNAPSTPLTQRTRKGVHFFYRPGEMKITIGQSIGPDYLRPAEGESTGIDFRAEGGFVIVAPSVILGHKYQWQTDGASPHTHHNLPSLDPLGEAFFCADGRTTRTGSRKRPHGPRPGPGGYQETVYDPDTGLIVDGRESFLRDTVMAVAAAAVRETGHLPSVDYVAQYAWELFCQRVDFTDGKWTFAHCVEKAEYVVRRIAEGTVVIGDDDAEIGDAIGYAEMVR